MKTDRSKPFIVTRGHHDLEAAEDYTELILDLSDTNGEVRTGQIAESLGISHVTALRTIRRLQKEGYVDTAPRRPIILTDKGRKLGIYAKKRHKILLEFFISLGVPLDVAEIDVEGAEHHISKVTLDKVEDFLESTKR